ncbi:tyrosine-type recombinase/integrase [Pseudonocardia sp. ICBG162]|uniref:tyrosine-type recombinase/integrase n=1 Tax=Pseudonocardia sp. ICBG162 TaxID=2846761 RepID=UPI001CF66CB5|nr:tyrosine-type recombinase/integrase [Pseudonocardia sp. ICBG162]
MNSDYRYRRLSDADTLADLLPDYDLYLRASGKSPNTVAVYTRAARELVAFLGDGVIPRKVTHRHIQRYLAHLAERPNRFDPSKGLSPGYINQQYRSLLALFKWLTEIEEEIPVSPFLKVKAPKIPDKLVPVIPDQEMRALIRACEGTNFTARRDMLIVRLLIDTGARRAEIVNLRLSDIELNPNGMHVVGKGNRPRIIPFGTKTAQALRRYLRSRARHRLAETTDRLLLGTKGPMAITGLRSILNKRAEQAGIPHVHPHRFRHTLASAWIASGGSETDLMHLAGWKSREMLSRYGASAAADRAREAHRRKALGDRF